MVRVIWTEPALLSLREIVRYIADDSPMYAKRIGQRIVEAPRKLRKFPYSGRVVPEFQNENIRELIYESYRIIYLLRDDHCYIVSVIHGSRDLLSHIDPGEWILD